MLANKKRKFPRATLCGTAQVTQGSFRCAGEITSVSAGGVFISGIPRLSVGAEYRLHLILPRTFEPVFCRAEVVYNLPATDDRRSGSGFRFTVISEDGRSRISKVVEQMSELFRKLLGMLTSPEPDRDAIDELCLEAGFPHGTAYARLRWMVLQAVNNLRVED